MISDLVDPERAVLESLLLAYTRDDPGVARRYANAIVDEITTALTDWQGRLMREAKDAILHQFDETLVSFDWADPDFPKKAGTEALRQLTAWNERGDEFARRAVSLIQPETVAALAKLDHAAWVGEVIGYATRGEREALVSGLYGAICDAEERIG